MAKHPGSVTALDEIEHAHRSVGGTGPGRRYLTQHVNQAYVVLLASQIQGFCRDFKRENAVDPWVKNPQAAREPGPYREGDRVRLLWGVTPVDGVVIEDRGNLGAGGRRLCRVRVQLDDLTEPIETALPADELVLLARARAEQRATAVTGRGRAFKLFFDPETLKAQRPGLLALGTVVKSLILRVLDRQSANKNDGAGGRVLGIAQRKRKRRGGFQGDTPRPQKVSKLAMVTSRNLP